MDPVHANHPATVAGAVRNVWMKSVPVGSDAIDGQDTGEGITTRRIPPGFQLGSPDDLHVLIVDGVRREAFGTSFEIVEDPIDVAVADLAGANAFERGVDGFFGCLPAVRDVALVEHDFAGEVGRALEQDRVERRIVADHDRDDRSLTDVGAPAPEAVAGHEDRTNLKVGVLHCRVYPLTKR